MKYGFNLLLWTTHVTAEHFPLLAKLKAAGYDGVELPLFEGDAAHFKTVRKALDDHGLACTAVTVVGPDASPISPDAGIRKKAVERINWAIDMAAVCGGEALCGPYHSPLAVFTGVGPTDDEKNHAVEVLRQAAEHAAANNVMLAIEYLNRFECYFLTTAADTVALVRAVDHPSFRCM
jgi:D-psicose/D-tagatose/L-ribulose 3-epimerase